MPRSSYAFTSFTAGEASPRLDGRTDLAKYFNMCSVLENFVTMPHGGVTRRPGTKFVSEVKTSSLSTRLISFEFSVSQTYILELGNLYMRFYRDGGQIAETGKTISGATQANPVVVTASSHGFSNGDEVYISGIVGTTELNGRNYLVANKTTNTFELTDLSGTNINGSGHTAYGSAGTAARIYTITTPWTTAQLFDIKVAQSNDVMYLVHSSHAVRKLTRTAHTAWTLDEVVFELGPMQSPNNTTTTLTANGLTGSVTITASAVTGINSDTGFQSADIGRLIKLLDGYAKITAVASTTQCTATVQTNEDLRAELLPTYVAATISFVEGDPSATGAEHNDRIVDTAKEFLNQGFKVGQKVAITGTSSNNVTVLIVGVTDDTILVSPSDDFAAESASSGNTLTGSIPATDEWSLGAFSDQTGYPSSICFYDERLVMAGTTAEPQTIFFSETGGFEQFAGGTSDASAMNYTIASQQVNVIRFLQPGRVLIVGTSGGEFSASSGSAGEPITPTNVQIKRQTTYGSSTVPPVQSGNAVLFLQRAKRKIRELVYNFDVDGYVAPDLTILAEHVSAGGFVDIDIQQEPDNVIWACRADGVLCGLTYRREEKVVAWHRHIVGGISGACTVTVTDYANIAVGTKLVLTKSDGTTVTFTSEPSSGASPSSTLGFRPNESNDTTADNIFTAVNAHSDFTVANPAANVVTIFETTRSGVGPLSIVSGDTTRLTTTDQSHAIVESVASIPGDLNEDDVYVVVQRTVDGATKRYVELLTAMDFGSDVADAFYVDAGLTYDGVSANSISGLNHLEGEEVRILGDGAAHADKTVSSGSITLDRSVKKAHIGLGYNSTLRTKRDESGSQDGTAQAKLKRITDFPQRIH